jgi:hypothetical protein
MTDFRFGGERVVGAAVRIPGLKFGTPGPHRRQWLIRPDDLLVFDVGRLNLRIEPGKNGKPATLEREGPGDAFLIVTLPPQHLTEIAYFTVAEEFPKKIPADLPDDPEPPQDPPIESIIAGWSRLAFVVPDSALPIKWTSQGVLEAIGGLELNVAANALPPRPPLRELLPMPELVSGPFLVASGDVLAAAGAGETAIGGVAPDLKAGYIIAGPSSARAFARARRGLRTTAYALGLVDLAGSVAADAIVGHALDPDLVISPGLLRPKPAPPADNETAIELPWRLVLSPSRHGAWFHSANVVSGETGRTELWHTRLGSRQNGDIVRVDPKRTLRAIWALSPPGWMQVTTPDDPQDEYLPPEVNDDPFRTSLNEYDRHSVVHLSSNFRLKKPPPSSGFFEPPPLDVDHMALSSLGGWLDSRGVWSDQPLGLKVEEWRHRATLGRDHFVRVVYAGRLFPLGHRASLVKVTERRFEPTKPGNPAYLRQRMFVVVREPLRTYRQSGWTYKNEELETDPRNGERWDLKLPFKAIRITTRVSPLLDRPEDHPVDPAKPDTAMSAFWPYVAGRPFCFGVVATDVEGQSVDLAMPLIFLGQDQTDEDFVASIVPTRATESYRTGKWPGLGGGLLATVPVGGQLIAYAESDTPDDTTFATRSLTFDVEVPGPKFYDKQLPRTPRFLPVLRTAQLDVPALQKIAQTTAAAGLLYDTTYLHNAFEAANGGQVFLARDPAAPALGVPFSKRSERSGGLVAPDLSLSGLSRISGPVSGDIDLAAAGTMDPAKWFADVLDGAKLFGVLSLADIVKEIGFNELDKLPRLAGGALDQVQKLVADLERLRTLLNGLKGPEVANLAFLLDQLVNPTSGSIAGLFKGGDSPTVWAHIQLVENELTGLPAAIASSTMTAGPRAVLTEAADSLQEAIAAMGPGLDLLEAFARGDFMPEDVSARFEWRPELQKWPSGPNPIFVPRDGPPYRNLLLSVEASGEELTVTCSLDKFNIDLEVLILEFERVQFRSRAGRKPEIDVSFTRFAFAGPLSFIESLRQVIPLDGFSDPPEVSVTAEGISAGFSMGLPNIAFGVFSLENLSLGAGFTIPFVGPPMSTWFRFCERENPSRLTVMMFGGGFFFGVTVDAKGLQVAEGAIEFGAAISVNFGVASGSVSAMAGLYFKIEADNVTLAGYFRLRGEVDALGIVSVSIELYLEMKYESGSGKCVGTATISIDIEVALFSTTIEISCSKKFAGSGNDPTLAEMFDVTPAATSADWNAYCGAFA